MEELQSWWEIPSIGQYVSLFRFDFKLPEMDLEELEEALLDDEKPLVSPLLENLIVALIRGCYPRAGVNEENWEFHLKKLLQKKFVNEEGRTNPLSDGTAFNKLPLREKVVILHSLCFYRLESGDVPDLIKTMDADALRVQSLGRDELGNVYWYFYGTRLYKEEPSEEKKKDWQEEWKQQKKQSFGQKKRRGRPRKCRRKAIKSDGESEESEENDKNGYMNLDAKSRWSVVCTTLEEWVDFTEKYKNTKSKHEIALFKLLSTNFLPHLHEMYQEKEKRLKQKIMELIPRRLSTRIETRKRTRSEKSQLDYSESNGYNSDDEHRNQAFEKEKLSRDRAQRLEERNQRRISEQIMYDINKGRPRSKEVIERKSYGNTYETSNANRYETSNANRYETSSEDESPVRLLVPTTCSTGKSDMRSKIHQVVTEVKMCKDAWPFLYPVDDNFAPGYHDTISEPIDLSTIENNLITGVYKSLSQVDNDFRKMVTNCQLYNGAKSEFSAMAITLWKIFRKGISKLSQQNTEATSPPPPQPVAAAASQPDQETREETPSVSNNEKDSDRSDSSKGSGPAAKRKRKKKPTPGLRALNMLAQASVTALKNAHREESASYSESSSDSSYKPKASFSDLNIVPIHSVSKSNSLPVQEVETSYISQTYTSQHTQYDEVEMQDQSYDSVSAHSSVNNYSGDNYDNSNESNNFVSGNGSDTYNSPNDSNGTTGLPAAEPESISSYNAQPETPNNLNMINSVDNQFSNLLAECNNENMSNFISKLIKDNQNYQIPNPQNVGLPSNQIVNTDHMHTSSISPKSDTSAKLGNLRNSPTNPSHVFPTQPINPMFQGSLEQQPSLENFQPNNEITTVDASALGLSNLHNFYPQGMNESNNRMPFQNTFSNHTESSKKQSTTIASLLATERFQDTITSNATNKKTQRCSPVYVAINTNQPNLVNMPSNFGQVSVDGTGNFIQPTNFIQGPLTQLPNVSLQVPNQNFILQDAAGAPTSVAATAQTFNKMCNDQNVKLTESVNTFLPNQLSPRQVTMANGQIMILTQNQAQPMTTMASTLNFLPTNAPGVAYQQPMYNNGISTEAAAPTLTVESQSNTTIQKTMRQINASRPPKKRSPLLEQYTTSSQVSPSTSQISNINTKSTNHNVNVTYSQPMQVFSAPVNSQLSASNMDPNQEMIRNSVIMSNVSQSSPICTSQNVVFSNGGTINTTNYDPTCVSSSGNNLYSTMANVQPNYSSNNHVLNSVQNGVKKLKPTTIVKNKNGQYIIISSIKGSVPSNIRLLTANDTFSPVQSFSNNLNQSSSSSVGSNAPRFINVNNALLQTLPIQGFPVKSAPMLSEVPTNQLPHFVNIPQYIMTTQSPTVIQQSPLFTQSVNSTNQRQPMENR